MNPGNNTPSLLIIDDNISSCMLVNEVLDDTGINIIETEYGREALKLFTSHSGDIFLVLLDLCLPDYDGFDLLTKLRAIGPKVPVVAFTAMSAGLVETRCRESGFDDIVYKPFDLTQFKEKVLSYLNK